MHTGKGRVVEMILEDGYRYTRLSCPDRLVPGPGQYLLANDGSDSILPVPIFYTDSMPQGFIGSAPDSWKPGDVLHLRGPLGRGFSLPVSARKVGLIAFNGPPSRLRGLIQPALRQNASVVVLCDTSADHLPDDVEVQPLSTLEDILKWVDFIALDLKRENLLELRERLGERTQLSVLSGAQVLIHTPMPCGGAADCAVCAVTTKSGWGMTCKDGPVFDLREL
jgi:NAD(P)H-flavin reductase